MSDYFDVISFKKTKADKPYAVKLGSAKKRDDGGFSLYLDAIPAPENGQFIMAITPRRESAQQPRGVAQATREPARQLDDEIPF
jgi:hypothetical protein